MLTNNPTQVNKYVSIRELAKWSSVSSVKNFGSTAHIHTEEVMEKMLTHMNSAVAFVLTFDLTIEV